jgi:hypothetical protein
MGFDPLVNQRLLPPTFPRYTKIMFRAQALEYFEELLKRLKFCVKSQFISQCIGKFKEAYSHCYCYFHLFIFSTESSLSLCLCVCVELVSLWEVCFGI